MELVEIIVPKTNEEISCSCNDNEYCQRACTNFLGDINNSYPNSERAKFIKRTCWVHPCTVRRTPLSGAPKFYTEANKSGNAGYKSENLS